jgi:hypothetical protein
MSDYFWRCLIDRFEAIFETPKVYLRLLRNSYCAQRASLLVVYKHHNDTKSSFPASKLATVPSVPERNEGGLLASRPNESLKAACFVLHEVGYGL